jgi:hypothetical protein
MTKTLSRFLEAWAKTTQREWRTHRHNKQAIVLDDNSTSIAVFSPSNSIDAVNPESDCAFAILAHNLLPKLAEEVSELEKCKNIWESTCHKNTEEFQQQIQTLRHEVEELRNKSSKLCGDIVKRSREGVFKCLLDKNHRGDHAYVFVEQFKQE